MTKFLPLLGLLMVAAPVAAEPLTVETVTISTADLDLASKAGQRALDARLNRAVIDLCGTASDADLVGQNAVRECRSEKLAEARNQRDQLAQRKVDKIQLAMR